MKQFTLLTLMLVLNLCLLAQESFTVYGFIRNSETEEIIEYATIGIKGKAQGTISNELGEFSFIIDEPSEKDEIVFSAIGYKARSFPLAELMMDNEALEVLLDPATYSLEEIVVTGVNPLDIVEKALEGIYKNYPTSPHLLKGFYREYMEEDGAYVRLIEAAVDIIEDGYKVKGKNVHSREKVLVKQIRNADEYRKFDAYLYDGLSYMLNENIAGYNPGGVLNTYPASDWKFEFEEKTLVEGEETYVISFIPRSEKYARPSGLVYLSTEDYSIVKMDWSINNALDSWLKKYYSDTVYIEHKNWEANFSYKRFKDKMYLNYIKHTRSYDVIDSDSNNVIHSVNVFSELLINDINNITTRAFTDTKTVKDYNKAYFSERPYDKEFWDAYNLPMATRKMRSCYNSLNQLRELERILTYDPSEFLNYDEFGTKDTSLRLEKYELWFDLDEDIIEGEPDFWLENEADTSQDEMEPEEEILEESTLSENESVLDSIPETIPKVNPKIMNVEEVDSIEYVADSIYIQPDTLPMANDGSSSEKIILETDSIGIAVDTVDFKIDSLEFLVDTLMIENDSLLNSIEDIEKETLNLIELDSLKLIPDSLSIPSDSLIILDEEPERP